MSTRARIGFQFTSWDNKEKIVSVYNHSDGYPSYVGRILMEHYNTPEKITRLLRLGDISALGTEPVDCPEMWDSKSPIYQAVNSLSVWNVCRTYRGRGEEGCEAKISDSAREMIEDLGEEYCYLYKDGKWFVIDITENDDVRYTPVEDAIREELKAC